MKGLKRREFLGIAGAGATWGAASRVAPPAMTIRYSAQATIQSLRHLIPGAHQAVVPPGFQRHPIA